MVAPADKKLIAIVVTMPDDFQARRGKLGNDTLPEGRAACGGSTK